MSEDQSPSANGSRGAGTVIERLRKLMRIGRFAARNELSEALAEADPSESLSPLERAMLRNVLTLRQVTVDDVMIPRADIVAAPNDITLAELLALFRTAGHSRLPVYEDTLDDPRGMIHIRDFLEHIAARAETQPEGAVGLVGLSESLASVKQMLRPVLFAPGSMPVMDLLVKMQASRTHMALVIDEYGGTEGLVSIEDLVEVIVGDIEDEHDEEVAPEIVTQPDGDFVIDARASLEDVRKALDDDLVEMGEAEDVDTLGGLVAAFLGRVPTRGEIVTANERFEIEVIDADPRRIKKLRIHRKPAQDDRALAKPDEKGDKSEA